ncbi:hypothetical protein GH714_001981 [Hevea brasiliensis]|uniref:Carboxypeptidase n=1 Tax=Hevea brasiliensis TaxID=3981 RepID=A0A6A6LVX4_HEVBR|nr:hypothetical protein GH714_001981 [Hevea brasiliensis]
MELASNITVLLTLIIFAVISFDSVESMRRLSLDTDRRFNSPDNEHLVTNLPGQPHVDFRHYAGYVTVNEKNGRALFYWFYEATTHPDGKPLVLWLNGEANMLFLESPVGVGFSYSNSTSDYDILGDDFTANDAYAFLHNWLLKFPSYRTRAFYIAGESYAGKYVPELAELIHDRNADPFLHIDLRGILMGNPETSDAEDWTGMVDYAWSHAVISDETHKIIRNSCNFNSNDTWSNDDCNQAVDELFRQYKEIDILSLYTSICIGDAAISDDKSVQVWFMRASTMMPRIMGGYDPCLDEYARAFYNRPDVQKALRISDGHQLKNWNICNRKIFNEWSDSKPSVLPIYKKLIAAGLRIWVYSGDTDGRVPVLSTRYSLGSLGLPVNKAWRPWYHQKQVSGWFQEYKGLMFATFRGAGHAVPIFKPSESLAFFSAFLQGESPPSSR